VKKNWTIPQSIERMVKRIVELPGGGISPAQIMLIAAREEGLVTDTEANIISDTYQLGLNWEV
jgi:hypothetical protein